MHGQGSTVETIDRVALPPPPPAPLATGALLGDWQIERQIGEGGMGTVYSAVHAQIGKRAAIKVIRTRVAEQLHAAERFLQEARIVNQIQHPNIVDIFQLGSLDDGRPYLVMELLQGESLGDRLERGRVSSPEAIDMLLQICQALRAAHGCGVVHRDLKPDNIFLAGPTVKLLDWGIAKMKDRPADAMDITGAGSMVGTPRYVAPEQARGLAVDERTDVYSLGCIAHELFLEAPPFTADNIADLLVAHLREPVAPPSEVWPDIPPVLERMILGMLEKDAERRMPLAEVVEALEQARDVLGAKVHHLAIGSGPVVAPPPPQVVIPTPIPGSLTPVVSGTEVTQLSELPAVPRRRSPWPGLVAGTLAIAVAALVARAVVHYEPLAAAAPGLRVSPSQAALAPTATPVEDVVPVLAPPTHEVPQVVPAPTAHAKGVGNHQERAPRRKAAKRVHPDATIDPFAEE